MREKNMRLNLEFCGVVKLASIALFIASFRKEREELFKFSV
jgi:hypothetical protein